MYRVSHLLVQMGRVDLLMTLWMFHHAAKFLSTKTFLRIPSGVPKIKVNQTQVHDRLGHNAVFYHHKYLREKCQLIIII